MCRAWRRTLRVAEDLGAEVTQVQGDVVTELVRVARERNVTRIVIGQSSHSRWHNRSMARSSTDCFTLCRRSTSISWLDV